jgi:hypothetical protein
MTVIVTHLCLFYKGSLKTKDYNGERIRKVSFTITNSKEKLPALYYITFINARIEDVNLAPTIETTRIRRRKKASSLSALSPTKIDAPSVTRKDSSS